MGKNMFPNLLLWEKYMTQEKTNRNYKDSVFVDLFARDITAKENFISLYNALHGTNLDVKTTDVQPVMLERVLYMKYYNDIAMLIDGKIVITKIRSLSIYLLAISQRKKILFHFITHCTVRILM